MASSSVNVDSKGIKALADRVNRVTDNLADANKLGRELEGVLRSGNQADRRAGLNRWGHRMPEIKPSTAEGRQRQGRGKGPFLTPGPGRNARESRTITHFFTALASSKARGFSLVFGWKDLPWLRYFTAKTRTDIVGLTPQTGKRVSAAIRDWLGGIFER